MHTAPQPRDTGSTFGDMLWEVTDLAGGVAVVLLPLLLLSVPGLLLFFALPALLLLVVAAVPVVVAGAIVAPVFLLVRSVRRRPGRYDRQQDGDRRGRQPRARVHARRGTRAAARA